jgi:CRISPR system Cascade subunit CasE
MYLSKVLITGVACRNPYEIHRVLWSVFPNDNGATRDFLFRVERADRNRADILLQSVRSPEISTHRAYVIACRDYDLQLQAGQDLRFLLVANPIKMINDENGRQNEKKETKKCRVPLIREEDQQAWLHRKLGSCASVRSLAIDPKLPLYFRKIREGRAGKIRPVVFQGIMRVEESQALRDLICAGVGPAKAFGCGLLSLAKA